MTIPASDIHYELAQTAKAINKPVCWFCKILIDDTYYAIIDIVNHFHSYKSHTGCLYQFFGLFCAFAFTIPKDGEVLARAA